MFHSVVLPYLGEQGIAELWRTIDAAAGPGTARRATGMAEPRGGSDMADVRLMTWPGAEARLLAHASFHGPPVRWVEAHRLQDFRVGRTPASCTVLP